MAMYDANDDAAAIFDKIFGNDGGFGSKDDGVGTPCCPTPYEQALRPVSELGTYFWETSKGTFVANGCRFGEGYAGITLTISDEGVGNLAIRMNQRVPEEHRRDFSKIIRRIDSSLIVKGFELDEDGWLEFRVRDFDMTGDPDDVQAVVKRAFSTAHVHGDLVTRIVAGEEPWSIFSSL